MRAFIGVTDNDWFTFLSKLPSIDEVNFWQPGGGHLFQALDPGEPFLFKLHSPFNYIVGGGFYAHSTLLPCSLAWATFGEKNGARSLTEMRIQIEKHRHKSPVPAEDYQIGCILLEQPFFFDRDNWIQAPMDWKSNIVQGKGYDLSSSIGKDLWAEVSARLRARFQPIELTQIREIGPQYGSPVLVLPRLGQGSFRVLVTDAYQRKCAVTQERTLPALEAGHIKPFSESGPHKVSNGVLLRSDIHRLLDAGYVTITPDYRLEVSRRIREEFENGRDYYAMNGLPVHVPIRNDFRPAREFITWHNQNIFRG